MRAIQRVDQIIDTARKRGVEIRFEMLAGQGGGFCRLGKKEILFMDLSLSPEEQLEILQADKQVPPSSVSSDFDPRNQSKNRDAA